MKSLLAFVALFVLCSSALLATDKPDWNGYWWTSMTPSFKLGWVSGYTKAMDLAGTLQMSMCAANLPFYKEKFPNLDSKDIFQRMCANNTEFNYDGIAMGQFVDGMDTFYKDYRNKQIEVGTSVTKLKANPPQNWMPRSPCGADALLRC